MKHQKTTGGDILSSDRKVVISKTPLRIGLVGGGTDIPAFYSNHSGQVVSIAINKYVYVTVKRHHECFGELYRINYSKTEIGSDFNRIENSIIRGCLDLLKVDFPVYIETNGDLPAGSGLGSSSSFCVGLLNGLSFIQGKFLNAFELAELACEVELNLLKKFMGKQDQYAAAFGGCNSFIFTRDDVSVEPLRLSKNCFNFFVAGARLHWTRTSRNAEVVLENNYGGAASSLESLLTTVALSEPFADTIRSDDLDLAKSLFREASSIKTREVGGCDPQDFLDLPLAADDDCFVKVCGAGGGGFIYLAGEKIQSIDEKLDVLKFDVDYLGSRVIYSE